MARRSVLIIGAGIGGLSTGCYAQMNGYRARIVEMHSAPGGVCTSWARNGYVFDGCIHNLAGTIEASPFRAIWRELGVVPRLAMRAYREVVTLDRPGGGAPFTVYADLDRLEAHMLDLFPVDAAEIRRFIAAARRFEELDLLGLAAAGPMEKARAIAAFPMLSGIGAQTLERYARRFKDPFLRQAFPSIVYDWPQQSMFMLLYFLARMNRGDLGWPMGGSGAFSRAIEARFRELGGEIRYGARVASIIVEGDHAQGVRFEDGSEERADIVVSNAYGPTTIFDMLGGRYANAAIRRHYAATPEDKIEMGVHVSLGLARDLAGEPHAIVLPLDAPAEIDGAPRARLYLQCFGYDPSLAPPGKGVLKVLLASRWSRWEALAQTPERYKAEQQKIAETVIGLLAKRFPGIERQVEASDVATPMTQKRFTGNGPGYPLAMTDMARALLTGHRLSQRLPGLRDFYMVGQWAGMPGVPTTAAMGRDVVRQICGRDGRRFATFTDTPPRFTAAAA